MKPIDKLYQAAVDKEAEKILKLSIEDFFKVEDYGTIETSIKDEIIEIGFWHWKLNDNLHHVVFMTNRRVFLFLYSKYLSGVKLDNGVISKMTDKEVGDYD